MLIRGVPEGTSQPVHPGGNACIIADIAETILVYAWTQAHARFQEARGQQCIYIYIYIYIYKRYRENSISESINI